MPSNIIAKIIMLPSGSVHIALANGEAVVATVNSIDELLSNTPSFVKQLYQNYVSSTKEIYPKEDSETTIDELPALTLCDVYRDYRYDVLFPVVHNIWKNKLEEKVTAPINMHKYIKNTCTYDPTVLFLRFCISVIDSLFQNILSSFNLSWELGRIEQIIADIIRTLRIQYRRRNLHKENTTVSTPIVGLSEAATDPKPTPPKAQKKATKTTPKKKLDEQMAAIDNSTFSKVQNILKKNYSFSDEVRKYIRSVEEANYYEFKEYKEILWDGQRGLIIKVDLDYFCISQGKTNREIIMDGGSPVVPGDESNVYHIHHVGQNKKSPFAIISKNDHDIKFYSVFHDTKSKSEDLHTSSFNVAKWAFWKNYVKMCERYDGFENIPSVEDKSKNKGKNKR